MPIPHEPHPYGKIWIREADGSILKIVWDQTSLGNFGEIASWAAENESRPLITAYSGYRFGKNGLRFPSRNYTQQAYIRKDRSKFVNAEISVVYKDYKFFTVETEVVLTEKPSLVHDLPHGRRLPPVAGRRSRPGPPLPPRRSRSRSGSATRPPRALPSLPPDYRSRRPPRRTDDFGRRRRRPFGGLPAGHPGFSVRPAPKRPAAWSWRRPTTPRSRRCPAGWSIRPARRARPR
ncbi:MAG: hypothetical protein MZW92_03390 [Comamonadaceae bacterium]|nr:hypothetical protein [Comamonadaceae bacterium]